MIVHCRLKVWVAVVVGGKRLDHVVVVWFLDHFNLGRRVFVRGVFRSFILLLCEVVVWSVAGVALLVVDGVPSVCVLVSSVIVRRGVGGVA